MNVRAFFPALVLLLLSALSLVNSQYQARRLFVELENSQARLKELEVEWRQLELDQSSLAKHARIESQARAQLGMMPPGPGRTQYLTSGAN